MMVKEVSVRGLSFRRPRQISSLLETERPYHGVWLAGASWRLDRLTPMQADVVHDPWEKPRLEHMKLGWRLGPRLGKYQATS